MLFRSESYAAERKAAAIENICVTARTSRFLAPQSTFERRLRKGLLELAHDYPFARALVNTGRLSLPNQYPLSQFVKEGGGSALSNFTLRDSTGAATGLSDVLSGLGLACLGLYLPRPGFDPVRAAISGIGGDGLPYTVRTLDIGQGASHCALADSGGYLQRATGVSAGDLIIIRPDLYCAGVLRSPSAADVERSLAAVTAFGA